MSASTGSDRARRMASRLLRWYPRPWRVRYEREMRALIEDIPVDWRQVANLAVTAVREWLSPRAFGWPARSAAGRLFWIRALTFVACWYALDGVARVVAARLVSAGVELTESMELAAAMLGVAFAIRICLFGMLASARRMSKRSRADRLGQRSWVNIRDWELVVWALLMWPLMVSFYAETPPDYLSRTSLQLRPYTHLLQIYVWAWMGFFVSVRTQRLMRIQSSDIKRRWKLGPFAPIAQ